MFLYLGVFWLFKGAVACQMVWQLVTCQLKHFLTLIESNGFAALTVFRADQLSLPWKQRTTVVELDTDSISFKFLFKFKV